MEANPALKDQLSTTRETTVLYTAARAGHLALVRYLVQVAGCAIDRANGASSNGSTALHGAAFGGHCQVLEFLVGHGATLQENAFGDTALQDLEIADITDGQREACRTALRPLQEPPAPPAPPVTLAPAEPALSAAPTTPPALAETTHSLAQTSPQPESHSVTAAAKRPDPQVPSGVADDVAPPAAAAVSPVTETQEQKPAVLTAAEDAPDGKRPLEDEHAEAPEAKKPKGKVSKPKPKPKPKPKGGAKGQALVAKGPGLEELLLNPVSKESIAELKTAEVTVTEVEKDTQEFWDQEENMEANMQSHHEDYCEKRLAEGKRPMKFKLKKYEKVSNEVMTRRFQRRWEAMQKEGKDLGRIRTSFHGTFAEHIPSICKTSLLRFKHPLNPCKDQSDEGYFGSNRKGVYVSRYVEYTLKYANDGEPLDAGQTAKILKFQTLPGRSEHIQKLVGGIAPTPGFHSHSSPNHLEWYLFNEDQLCLEAIMTVEAYENTRTDADDEALKSGR